MTTLGPYEVHPIADTWPLVEGDEFADLVRDIRAHGLNNPITVTDDGKTLVDGRNRYRACIEAGVEPHVDYAPVDWDDQRIAGFINSQNRHRRQCTPGQLAFVLQEQEAYFAKLAKKRQGARNDLKRNITEHAPESSEKRSTNENEAREQAAKGFGISGRSVGVAKRIAKEAPKLAEEVKAGRMTLTAAESKVKAAQRPPVQHTTRPAPKRTAPSAPQEPVKELPAPVPNVAPKKGDTYLERAVWAVSDLEGATGIQLRRITSALDSILRNDNPDRAMITALDAVVELAALHGKNPT